MRKFEEHLKSVESLLREATDNGTLEPARVEAARKALKDLRHGLRLNDPKKIRRALAKLAKAFLK